jgi:two-component system, NarL family, response regulator DesR
MTASVSSPSLRVMFVDDNVLAARSLERWFGCAPGITFAGWASDRQTALTPQAQGSPHVILLDLEMPGIDTIALIGELGQVHTGARIVMLSGHVRPPDIGAALDAGAAGYICKDEPTATIYDLVRRAATGECVLSPLAQKAFMGTP